MQLDPDASAWAKFDLWWVDEPVDEIVDHKEQREEALRRLTTATGK